MNLMAKLLSLQKKIKDKHTLSVRSIERNFRLSPTNIQWLMIGNSSFTDSSIGQGAIFSPPAVIINSENINKVYKLIMKCL